MERRREIGRWLALREREGLTFRALAERSGIPVGTLAWWAWRARKQQSSATGSQRFVEVGVVDESRPGAITASLDDEIELVIDERVRLRVGSSVEVARVAKLVQALLSC